MPETEQTKQSDFMIEKIKARPINKKNLIRRTIITAAMAVIFGLIACFTFLVLEPVISNWLYPEEPPQTVEFPEDQEEMSPEEMLSDYMQQVNQAGDTLEQIELEEEQIQEILSEITLSKDNYKQLYSALSLYVKELKQFMVTITAVTSNIDWFDDIQESRNQASGIIIAENDKEILVLTEYVPLQKAESLSLTFYNGMEANAHIKAQDTVTDLAVLSVDLNVLPSEFVENNLKIAAFGSSNLTVAGTPVVALGSPMGINGSLGYGMVSAVSGQQTEVDANFRLLQTDIVGSQNASGVLFNLQGQVIGIITNDRFSSDMKNMITAYGITELRTRLEKISNGEKFAYLGISGIDVTEEANEEWGVPYGAYVKNLEMNSPAMLAGIRQGDVVVGMKDNKIESFGEYVTNLLQCEANDTVNLIIMRQAQDGYREITFTIVLDEAK